MLHLRRALASVSIAALVAASASVGSGARAQEVNPGLYFPSIGAYKQLPTDVTTIVGGTNSSYYIAPIASLYATQYNLGAFEVAKKGANDTPPYGKDAGYYPIDGITPSSKLPSAPGPNYDAYMLGQTTPVVIGPGGKLYATDKQHTDLAVLLGYQNVPNFKPYAYIYVLANYSNLTEAQFEQTMINKGLVLLENNGQPATFAGLPTNLLATGNDNYRGLEYQVIKNKYPGSTVATVVGADKADVPFFEFIVADSYRKAGLRYLTGADTNFAAAWSLNPKNFVDANTSKLIPGFILPAGAVITPTQPITDATLGGTAANPGTAAIDNTGGFTGLVTQSGGKPDYVGLLIQTGNDLGGVVSLNGVNTYHGGTVLQAGTLRINSDAALGDPSGPLLFRSIGEGNGTLQAAANLTINRNIDVGAETATIDPAGFNITINGVISGTTGLTFANQGNSPGNGKGGVVTLTGTNTTEGSTTVKSGVTLQISSDSNLGNNNYAIDPNGYFVGSLSLSGSAVLQTLGAVNSKREIDVTGAATINPNSFSSTFGTLNLTDTNLTIGDISGVSTAGSTATTINTLNASGGAILTVDNTNAGAGNNTSVQIAALNRTPTTANYVTPYQSTLVIDSVTGALVTSGAGETVKATNAPALTNGIVDPWVLGQAGKTTSPYDFLTYAGGFKTATYTSTNLATSAATDVVNSGATTINSAANAYALKLAGAIGGAGSLTLGNGTNPAGLILNGGTLGIPLNVGKSELIVTSSGTSAINGVITGTNGLTTAGTGALTLGAAENLTGAVSVTGGSLKLNATDTLASALGGIFLSQNATLSLGAANTVAGLNGGGAINLGAFTLTVGEAGSTVYSLPTGKFTGTGSLRVSGGTTLDVSNAGGSALGYTGTTTIDTGATLHLKTTNFSAANTNDVTDNGTIMFDQGGGGAFNNRITGAGDLKLISGSMTLTNTGNNYSGGTNIFWGGTLYASTSTLPTASKVSNDGTLVIDQNVAGSWTGIISDYNRPGFGRVIIDDSFDAYNGDTTSGTAGGKTPYTQAATGNVTFGAKQLYTGATIVNYGTLTLGVADAIKPSSGVTLEPGAVLALGANNQIGMLASEGYATRPADGKVTLNGNTLTVGDSRNASSEFDGVVQDGSGPGALMKAGTGTLTLGGANTFTGTTTISAGALALTSGASLASPTINIGAGASLLTPGGSSNLPKLASLTNAGVLDLRNGTPGNVLAINGAYAGTAASQMMVSAVLGGPNQTADRLAVNSASGATSIVLQDSTPGAPATFNPNGIPIVVSNTTISPTTFSLAGGAIQKGLFQYDLVYKSDPAFLLVGVPTADAFRLATVPTAAQSIWLNTSGVWLDRQADLRDMLLGVTPSAPSPKIVKGAPDTAATPAISPAIWARAIGTVASRDQTQNYSAFSKTYAFDTGYKLDTGAFFGGVDGKWQGVAAQGDALLVGLTGGYINSDQNFKGSTTTAKYEGGSVGVTATYLDRNFFFDALLKADFLRLNYSAPGIAGFGATAQGADVRNLGVIADAGYRFQAAGGMFVEPLASLAYVNSHIDDLALAGSQITLGSNDSLRGRLGLRGGTTIASDQSHRVEAAATASFWGRLSGGATATINSGAGAPLLSISDQQVSNYGEVGLGLNYIALTSGLSGFAKVDYQFASGYNAGSIKGGVRYSF